MKVTVRYIKGGRIATMDSKYANPLVKLKRVEIIPDQPRPAFGSSFKSTIVTKPITEKDTVAKKWNAKEPKEPKEAVQVETKFEIKDDEVKSEETETKIESAAPSAVVSKGKDKSSGEK